MMHITVLAAGQEEDYRWVPDTPVNNIDEARTCLTSADKVNSLVAWRSSPSLCSVLIAKIPTGCKDSFNRLISCTLLVEDMTEPDARALIVYYLLERDEFYAGVQNAVDSLKEKACVDVQSLALHIEKMIEKCRPELIIEPNTVLFPGEFRNSMIAEPEYVNCLVGEFLLKQSWSPGIGVKVILSDYGRDYNECADILLTAKDVPDKPNPVPSGYKKAKLREPFERLKPIGKELKNLQGKIGNLLNTLSNSKQGKYNDKHHAADKASFRNAVRNFLICTKEKLSASVAQPWASQGIEPNDIPCVKKQIQHAIAELEKLENTRELCVQGYGLLQQLAGQPELSGDEPAMHAYLRSSTAAFAAIDNARRNFDEAVERCIAEQIPSAAVFRKRAESDEEKLLREFQPGGIAVSLADVLASAQKKPLRNIPENESQKKVTLNWRSLDSAVYALPEYSRYREAVVEAVQTLSVAMEELEFCLPADICVSEIREMDNFLRNTWKNFWQEQAPDGILVDSLKGMLQTIDMAFDRILSDSWAKELRLLKAEFRANPVKQYNHYYNPK